MLGYHAFGSVPFGAGLDWPAVDVFQVGIRTATDAVFDFVNSPRELLEATDEIVHTVTIETWDTATNSIVTLYLSDAEYATQADDDPASQPFSDALVQPLALSASIVNPDGFSGIAAGTGSIVISNGDGAYDFIEQERSLFGRSVEVRFGRRDDAYADHILLFRGRVVDYHLGESDLTISVEDNSYRLDTPFSAASYAGTGVANSDANADMAGKRKPVAVGSVSNLSPALIDAADSIFQAFTEDISQASFEVYANGVSVGSTGGAVDYATIADLAGASSSDDLLTCVAQGAFRLPFVLNETQITCDVDNPPAASVGRFGLLWQFHPTEWIINSLVSVLLHTLIEIAGFEQSEIDDAAFAKFYKSTMGLFGLPPRAGYFMSHEESKQVRDVVGELLSFQYLLGFNRDGRCYAGKFQVPSSAPVLRFDETSIRGRVERERLPDGLRPPPWRWRVGYGKNWTVMTDSVADGASTTFREFAASEYRVAVAEDEEILVDYPSAKERDALETYISGTIVTASAPAEADARRLLAMHGVPRSLYRFTVGREGALVRVGVDCVEITYPRFGLDQGKMLRVVSREIDAANGTVELVGWG